MTCWNSWHRWSLVSMIASALLAVTTARLRPTARAKEPIPLTRRELVTLLRTTALPPPRRDLEHVLHWSQWRRRHQHRVAACHHWNEGTAAAA